MTTDATDCTVWTAATGDATTRRVRVTGQQWEFTPPLVTHGITNWLAPSGSTVRVHRRQNASANAKGYTLCDTITREGVTGNGAVITVIPLVHLPTNGIISINVLASAVRQGDLSVAGHAVWTLARYRMTAGTLTFTGGTTPDKEVTGGVLENAVMDLSGTSGITMIADFGANTANVEIAFWATCISS